MEGVLLHASSAHEKQISPYIRNPNIINRGLIHRNFSPSNPYAAGVLQPPPPPFLYHSYPSFTLQPPPVPSQPPLLPLPTNTPRRTTTTTLARHLSCPPINNRRGKNLNNPKKSSKDWKESKPTSTSPKKEVKNLGRTASTVSSSPQSVNNINGIGANGVKNLDVKDLEIERQINDFSAGSSVFAISPPPSSLPLPTFSLRPKLTCKAQAASGVDTGATDNLRRLLRLP